MEFVPTPFTWPAVAPPAVPPFPPATVTTVCAPTPPQNRPNARNKASNGRCGATADPTPTCSAGCAAGVAATAASCNPPSTAACAAPTSRTVPMESSAATNSARPPEAAMFIAVSPALLRVSSGISHSSSTARRGSDPMEAATCRPVLPAPSTAAASKGWRRNSDAACVVLPLRQRVKKCGASEALSAAAAAGVGGGGGVSECIAAE